MFGCDKDGRFGFADVEDWFLSVVLSFPAPWGVAPRAGKFYGTVVHDARGKDVLSVWSAEGEPSHREKAYFGPDWTPEAWAEYCSDSHWESAGCLAMAERIVYLRNGLGQHSWGHDDSKRKLLRLVLFEARWEDAVFKEVACGGPQKRRLTSPSVQRMLGRS